MPGFRGGEDIAVKVPRDRFPETVALYRDVLGLPVVLVEARSVAFEFGPTRPWVDSSDHLSHAEVWLEVCAETSQPRQDTSLHVA